MLQLPLPGRCANCSSVVHGWTPSGRLLRICAMACLPSAGTPCWGTATVGMVARAGDMALDSARSGTRRVLVVATRTGLEPLGRLLREPGPGDRATPARAAVFVCGLSPPAGAGGCAQDNGGAAFCHPLAIWVGCLCKVSETEATTSETVMQRASGGAPRRPRGWRGASGRRIAACCVQALGASRTTIPARPRCPVGRRSAAQT